MKDDRDEPDVDGQVLRCVECDAMSTVMAEGWRALLTFDDELAVYCPDCAAREFGDVHRSA